MVDGKGYDVYTARTNNPNRIVSARAKKNKEAEGIVLDLSEPSVTHGQLGDILKRVRSAGATNIIEIAIIRK